MTRCVIDASVAVKWVFSESGSETAIHLKDTYTFHAPELIFPEVANVIRKKIRRGETLPVAGRLAIRGLMQAGIELHGMRALADMALEIAEALDHSAYDCFYLALAEELAVPFITADDRIKRKLEQSASVDTFNLEIVTLSELGTPGP